jgi:carotenoid cleavage dioxygenase-like enzyme
MGITENHSILMDLPLLQDQQARAAGKHRIHFDRSLPARFGVIPRHGDGASIRWFEARACYIYHVINAWEDGDEIVLDVCRVKNPQHQPSHHTPLARMLAYLRLNAHIYRYRFDLRTGRTTEGPLDDDDMEFPSVDTRVVSRPHRYSYSMHLATKETLLFDGLVRFDSRTGDKQRHLFGPGRWGGEAPFAPRDGSTGETDGYLVSFVTDEREQRSEVAIFDAADVAAGPVGRVLLPCRVPIGFHACWVPSDRV